MRLGFGSGTLQYCACTDGLNRVIAPVASARLPILPIASSRVAMSAVAAMADEVHQRAQEKQQINPHPGHMLPVLPNDEEGSEIAIMATTTDPWDRYHGSAWRGLDSGFMARLLAFD